VKYVDEILIGNSQKKIKFSELKFRFEDDIKMYLTEIGLEFWNEFQCSG
jgi:hypothetical protein